jgi:hypothetical protein
MIGRIAPLVAFCLIVATDIRAQGVFPDASFDATLRKYTPPKNVFSPFYSWDAEMALRLTVYRRKADAVSFSSVFQTIGTENLGSQISVGGTGYLLAFGYVHDYSADVTVSAGIGHLSSHLTRDLDDKLEEERNRGAGIPTVADPSEYNVVFVKGRWKLSGRRFTPEIEVALEPINFHLRGGRAGSVRPLYVATRATLWQADQKSIVVETQHEIGRNAFNTFAVSFGLYPRGQPEGRLQIFVRASPGHSLHVSPNIGAVRDGIAVGMRMRFRS